MYYLLVVDIMNFIKNNKFDVANDISPTIQHTPENFCCHDQAAGLRVDLYISGKDPYVVKYVTEIPKLLITQCFYW